MGEDGAKQVFQWLNSTGRFNMSHTIYDRHPRTGNPHDHCRIELLNGSAQNFDLAGYLLGEKAEPGDRLFVECKKYSEAGNQGTLYREYLAVCYSAFHRRWQAGDLEPSEQYMWATTHPFSQSSWTRLRTVEMITEACAAAEYIPLLGGVGFDPDVASSLADRLWVCVVNDRVEEMMMGETLHASMRGAMARLGSS